MPTKYSINIQLSWSWKRMWQSVFCNIFYSFRINHNFSAPRSPQQNGVAERKNRTLIEMARTILIDADLPHSYWVEAVSTTCFIINRVHIRPLLKKTSYELWKDRKPNIAYFHTFGCKCFVLNNEKDDLGKFNYKSDESIFLGYSSSSKTYRVYDKRTYTVEESIHVTFDESNTRLRKVDFLDEEENILNIQRVLVDKEMVSTINVFEKS